MKILGIETSSTQGSVALYLDGQIEQRSLGESRQQALQVLPTIDQLLLEHSLKLSDFDLFTFSAGPGSFTGIRIALGVIQGFALATDIQVLPVSSLNILAQTAYRIDPSHWRVICAIDAFMGEIYAGQYELNERKVMCPVVADAVYKPEQLLPLPTNGTWQRVGNAWDVYPKSLTISSHLSEKTQLIYPEATDLVYLAAENNQKKLIIDDVLPYYLRDKTAWQK